VLRDSWPDIAAVEIIRMNAVAGTESLAVLGQCAKQRAHIVMGIGHFAAEGIASTAVAALAAFAFADPTHAGQ
jgi:hypothetical protein